MEVGPFCAERLQLAKSGTTESEMLVTKGRLSFTRSDNLRQMGDAGLGLFLVGAARPWAAGLLAAKVPLKADLARAGLRRPLRKLLHRNCHALSLGDILVPMVTVF